MDRPYDPSTDSEGKDYVKGPGDGLGYYGGTLWPHLRCNSIEEAVRASEIANIAYNEGYLKAQRDIRQALGLSA